MALYTSKRNIIKIEVFMENFLDITYDGTEKLTHNVMRQFLVDKGGKCPARATFSHTRENHILNGTILLVKDCVGKTIAYHNPKCDFSALFKEIHEEVDPLKLEETRKAILESQNCLLLNNGMIVSKEETEEEEYKGKNRDRHVYLKTGRHVTMGGRR